MTDDQLDDNIELDAPEESMTLQDPPQYGVGPFSIREVALGGIWLVAFIVSFFSLNAVRFDSVWTSGLLWILTIGVPTAAVFLIGLRRLSPDGIRRVGSLGIDQFASVAFSVSTVVWLQLTWETVAVVIQGGPWLRSWVMWVELVLMLAAVFLTVFAPFIYPFDEDFRGRREIAAHRNARPIRPVTPRPAPAPRPVVEPEPDAYAPDYSSSEPYAYAGAGAAGAAGAASADASATGPIDSAPVDSEAWAPQQSRETFEPAADLEPEPVVEEEPAARQQAFWALVPEERDVVDEAGIPLFRIGPTAWALVIEDRGEAFVVRHEDGTTGFLHDVSDVTRG